MRSMKNILIFGALVLFTGCKSLMTAVNEAYNPHEKKYNDLIPEDEQKLYSDYTSVVTLRSDGKYISREFYPDTKTLIAYKEFLDRNFQTQDGEQKEWSDFGVLTNEVTFVNGKKEGPEKNFHYKTRSMISNGNWLNGEKDGVWTTYSDGVKAEVTPYENGKKNGEYKIYDTETKKMMAYGIYEQDSIIETKVVNQKKWDSYTKRPKADGEMPLFGKGCPELEDFKDKKACAEMNMLKFIYSNLKYPATARENDVEGTAIAQFVVDTEGRVTDIDVIRGICGEIRTEVTRVLVKMPRWVPGKQDGENVKVLYTLPIKFKLE